MLGRHRGAHECLSVVIALHLDNHGVCHLVADLREPPRHQRGRCILCLPDIFLRVDDDHHHRGWFLQALRRDVAGSARAGSRTTRGRSPRLWRTRIPLRRGFHYVAARLRKRWFIADGTGSHLGRRLGFPSSRSTQCAQSHGRDGIDLVVLARGHHIARDMDPRTPLRSRFTDCGLARSRCRVWHDRLRARHLLDGANRHGVNPLHRWQYGL